MRGVRLSALWGAARTGVKGDPDDRSQACDSGERPSRIGAPENQSESDLAVHLAHAGCRSGIRAHRPVRRQRPGSDANGGDRRERQDRSSGDRSSCALSSGPCDAQDRRCFRSCAAGGAVQARGESPCGKAHTHALTHALAHAPSQPAAKPTTRQLMAKLTDQRSERAMRDRAIWIVRLATFGGVASAVGLSWVFADAPPVVPVAAAPIQRPRTVIQKVVHHPYQPGSVAYAPAAGAAAPRPPSQGPGPAPKPPPPPVCHSTPSKPC